MADKWIVILTAKDVPWIFGPYSSERAAAKAAYVQLLGRQAELADA